MLRKLKKSKKIFIIPVFILAILAVSAALILFSCADTSDKPPPEKSAQDDLDQAAQVTPEPGDGNNGIVDRSLYDEPGIKNFGGYDFRILETPDSNVFSFHKQVPEEQTGEIVNDTFIMRNRIIEDRYNIAVSAVYNETPNALLQRSMAAGDDICDIGFVRSSEVFGLAQRGHLTDLNTVGALRTDMPWWDQRIIEDLAIYDRIFTLTGDITTNDDVSTLTILYNKKLYQDFGYENPYEIVSKGAWTMDKMADMIKGVNRDLNGDGVIDENDQWGMASEFTAIYYFFFGSGMKYIDKTPDGYKFTLDDAKVQSVLQKTFDLLTADDSIYDLHRVIKTTSVSVYATLEKMFTENRLLFNVRLVGDALELRSMESNFGFLPFPKYDEIQKEYYSWVTWNSYTLVMPGIIADIDRSGLITEALAFESMFTVREPFYGNLLNAKIARDDEDTQMLALILSSKAYDLDGVNNSSGIQSGLHEMMTGMLSKREFTLASSWEQIRDRAVGKLETFMQEFE